MAIEIIRYHATDGIHLGIVNQGMVYHVEGRIPGAYQAGTEVGLLEDLKLAPPIQPSKIICVARNYAAHAAEHAVEVPTTPMIFLKPPSSLVAHEEPIELPSGIGRVDLEAELAVIIGSRAKRVHREDALNYVLGYTCANDVSARVLQKSDGQWGRAKGFDTFCPLGPVIVTGVENPGNLGIKARLNGNEIINSNTSYMVFDVPYLIEFISQVMTLEPGDVILTGTPEGVTEIIPGDVVEIEVEGVGVLSNPVV
jgi:2-keto-4-pentenoate hydratase/2-oxohepta-3-ene-1,7-dioic acid hydratase in catechol pathway